MNSRLYQLTADYQRLMDLEVYTKEDLETLDKLPGFIEDKVIARAYIIRNLQYIIGNIKAEILNMQSRCDKLENNMIMLKQSCLEAMQTAQIKKIDKCPNFEIAVHAKKPRVDDYDREVIPERYWMKEITTVLKLNKQALHEDLAVGENIPGARLVDPVKLVIK